MKKNGNGKKRFKMKERAVTVFLLVLTVLAIFAVGRAVYGWATKPASIRVPSGLTIKNFQR